jgi:hypothetical protein
MLTDGLATGLWIFLNSTLIFGFIQRRVMLAMKYQEKRRPRLQSHPLLLLLLLLLSSSSPLPPALKP